MTKLLLGDALIKLINLEGQVLGSLTTPDRINKGAVGQIIEGAIGVKLSSDLHDFEDGELKTNKFLKGRSAETLAVTQVGHLLEEIYSSIGWYESTLLSKINSFILLPIHKDSDEPAGWVIGKAVHFSRAKYPKQYRQLEEDYGVISTQIGKVLHGQGELHTFNGPNKFIQLRTKDSKNRNGTYHPVKFQGRLISNKNYAFYLRQHFLNSVINS